ncbi:MAG: TIGR03067 domain-containing protein [Pirellulales bacterium]
MAGCRAAAAAALAMLTAVAIAADGDMPTSAGRWQVTRVEVNGKLVNQEFIDLLTVEYLADGSWVVLLKGLPVGEGTSRVDEAVLPKAFEMETLGSAGKPGRRYIGIYDTADETRRLCFVSADRPRPREFHSTAAGGEILVTLRRSRVTSGR